MSKSTLEKPASGGARLQELRRRLLSIQTPSAADPIIPLDHRILRLKERLDRCVWESACEPLEDAALLSGEAQARQRETQTLLPRVDSLQGELAPLRARLTEVVRSAALVERPDLRVTLTRALRTLDMIDVLLSECRGDANRQVAMLPAFEAILGAVNQSYARIGKVVSCHQRRASQTATLREIFCQILGGNRPRLQILAELAAHIIEHIGQDSYPELVENAISEPAFQVATHAINVAGVVAFLTSLDGAWRGQRLPLVMAALLLDVGMLRAAPGALMSASPLAPEERSAVERHPIESSVIAERIAGFDPSLPKAIAAHHERLDGSGYPAGLRHGEIPVPARILAVADAYVAMRSQRCHRPARSANEAMLEMMAQADAGRLDAEQVRLLMNLSLYPVGSVVELSTHEIAEVIAPQNAQLDPTLAARPMVRLIVDSRGNPFRRLEYRNLAIRSDARIVRLLTKSEAALIACTEL